MTKEEWTRQTAKLGMIYWRGKHPPDWPLAHNPVQPIYVDQQHGENGFRLFWEPAEGEAMGQVPLRLAARFRDALSSPPRAPHAY